MCRALNGEVCYEGFERLSRLLADMDRKQGSTDLPPEWVRQVLEEEAARGQEPPTATTE